MDQGCFSRKIPGPGSFLRFFKSVHLTCTNNPLTYWPILTVKSGIISVKQCFSEQFNTTCGKTPIAVSTTVSSSSSHIKNPNSAIISFLWFLMNYKTFLNYFWLKMNRDRIYRIISQREWWKTITWDLILVQRFYNFIHLRWRGSPDI